MPRESIACVKPIRVGTETGGATVRCGRCKGCRLRWKLAWTGRIRLEAASHCLNRFLTLTYRDEVRPMNLRTSYFHVQNFLKKYRNEQLKYNPDHKQRFFCVGEYGEESGHAHWHLILFGQATLQPDWMRKAVYIELPGWTDKWGFASDAAVNETTAGYIAGYCLKKQENHDPFARMSLRPGIGFDVIRNQAEAVYAKMGSHPLNMPDRFKLGDRSYPISDGLARHFRRVYTDLGGVIAGDTWEDKRIRSIRSAWEFWSQSDYRFERVREFNFQEKERVYGKALPKVGKKKL